jgi:5-methylcytosine-specific restriction endonuclease McrA
VAEVVDVSDGKYISYDFENWQAVSELRREFESGEFESGEFESGEFDWVRTVRSSLAVPKIIRVLGYHRIPRQEVKLNRRNIFARDHNTCQYCGRKFSTSDLSLDHVVPRSQGGGNSWQNIVCCCLRCNVRKGGRTPFQAGIKLIQEPVKPKRHAILGVRFAGRKYSSWQHFLDDAYWNVELK